MHPAEPSLALKIFLPASLMLIMFGLGLGLTLEDFKRVLRFPKAIGVGLFVQTILLPIVAYLLCRIFRLPPELAIGLMLLALSPGGFTSNILSHLAGGDVALNLTLAAVNCCLSVATLPFLLGVSVRLFSVEGQNIVFPIAKAFEVFALVMIPAGLGLVVNRKFGNFSRKMERPIRIYSIIFLIALMIGAVAQNTAIVRDFLSELAVVVVTFNLISLFLGYAIPRIFRVPRSQSIAIAMEIGIHNSALAMTVAYTVFGAMSYAMPAALYSVAMLVNAGILAAIIRRYPSAANAR